MNQTGLDTACDRLSHRVDETQFERLHWTRTQAPMLDRVVALAQAALESRPEFELVEEGATRDIKRFVLKVHSHRLVAIAMGIDQGAAYVRAEPVDRSRFRLADGGPVSIDYASVDEQWMAGALQDLFSRIHK